MKYKLICMDMDGTLLDDEKNVSDENLEAIKKANELGVKIAVCTGRLFTSAKFYANLLGVKTPVIASNGAYIREKDREDIIYKSVLGEDRCKKIVSIVRKYDARVYFNTFDSVIAINGFPDDEDNTYIKMNRSLPADLKIKLVDPEDIIKTIEEKGNDIVKCIFIDKDINKIQKARKELLELDEFEVVSSGIDNIEIMSKGVSKGRAAEVLAGYYNLNRDEVICIGDNENDISMIKYAGMGVAMGNGEKIVKSCANYITETNNKSGVAKAIEKLVLNNA